MIRDEIKLLNEEIKWCKNYINETENDSYHETLEFKEGFIKGLEQSKMLLKKYWKTMKNEN